MRYLVWILRLAIFVLVLLFALRNTSPVDVNFYADHTLANVPLIVVMLVAFVLGIVLGLLAAAPSIVRRRREARRLRGEVARLQEKIRSPDSQRPVGVTETVTPLAPF